MYREVNYRETFVKKILYVYGGPEFHPTEWGGKKIN